MSTKLFISEVSGILKQIKGGSIGNQGKCHTLGQIVHNVIKHQIWHKVTHNANTYRKGNHLTAVL